MTTEHSIIIVGGGIIGLSLAKALADRQFSVALVDQQAPDTAPPTIQTTAQVVALNLSSCRLLQNIGLSHLFPSKAATPFQRLHTWDEQHHQALIFDASAIKQPHLGYITEKKAITQALWESIENNPLIKIYAPYHPQSINTTASHACLTLDDGTTLSAPLLIGADGGQSWVRRTCRIPVSTRSYHHHALTGVIETEKPLNHTAWQSFGASGPLGVLPLHHTHQAAIVWSLSEKTATMHATSTTKQIEKAITSLLYSHLGQIKCLTPMHQTPLVMRHAKRYTGKRVVLVGDAAHTIHPLAGQGANLGFSDIAALVDIITHDDHATLGSCAQRQRYQRARRKANTQMLTMVRLFKDCLGQPMQPLPLLNQWAFSTLNTLPLLKNQILRYATLPQAGSLMKNT